MRTLKVVGTTLLLLVCLSPGVQAQDFLTITWKSELGCIETPIDSVQVTNLTKNWTKTVFYPENSIKLYYADSAVGINEVADFADRQILVKPNPFSQTAEVNFYVGKEGMVHVRLYDIFGRTVASLSQQMDCGTQQLLVNAGSSGHYFLSIETPTEKRVAKLLSTPARHSELVSESLTYKGIAGNTPLPPLEGGIASSTNAAKSPFEGGKGDVLNEGLPQKSDPEDFTYNAGDTMQFIAYATDTNGNPRTFTYKDTLAGDKEFFFINTQCYFEGTIWKLVHMVDVEADSIKVFDTLDNSLIPRENCYILTFDIYIYEDEVIPAFSAKGVITGCYGSYTVNCSLSAIQFRYEALPNIDDTGDGEFFRNIFLKNMRGLTSFERKNSELRLFYNDEKNYLLFNLIK